MATLKLFMTLLGAKPQGRHTEQHDIFFGIGSSLKDLIPDMLRFWPETNGKLHIDAWREVNCQDGYRVQVMARDEPVASAAAAVKLFFINLGGYKANEFEEYHYKMLVACKDKAEAIRQAKQTAFYKHTGFKGAESHIDDKYGIDVDDIYELEEILPEAIKQQYCLQLLPDPAAKEDDCHLGYFKLSRIEAGEL